MDPKPQDDEPIELDEEEFPIDDDEDLSDAADEDALLRELGL